MVETRPSHDASRTIIAALRTMLYPAGRRVLGNSVAETIHDVVADGPAASIVNPHTPMGKRDLPTPMAKPQQP